MKVKIDNLKDSQKLIRIEVEPQRVNAVLDDVYKDIQKIARIPGFRVGKAPRDLIEVHYNKAAEDEAVSHLVWESYRQAVLEQKIESVEYPVIEEVNFKRGEPLKFTARVDVRPEFKLKAYKGIRIKQEPPEVTDEEVNNALKNVAESLAQYKDIESRPIAVGDYIVCDYECFVEAKLVDKNNKLWLYINEQLQPKELLSALVGANKDVTKEVEVTHPTDYQQKELAGKRAVYKITPKQIKQKIVPELTDDLAKDTGHFKNLEELKAHLRQRLLKTKQDQIRQGIENQIFDNLLKNHSFNIPLSVVERQTQRLIEDAKLRLMYQGYKKEDVDKQDEQLKKTLSENAKDHVRIFFILDEIAKQERIEVTDEELDEKIKAIAKNMNEELSVVSKRLEEKNLVESLRDQMVQDKVAEFLLREAKKD